jgi:hypothetical protein
MKCANCNGVGKVPYRVHKVEGGETAMESVLQPRLSGDTCLVCNGSGEVSPPLGERLIFCFECQDTYKVKKECPICLGLEPFSKNCQRCLKTGWIQVPCRDAACMTMRKP